VSKAPENSKSSAPKNSGKGWNRFWFFVGLLPFYGSLVMVPAFHSVKVIFAPVLGFAPVDFLYYHSSPSPAQIGFWCSATVIAFFAFGVLAFFKRPFGILFALASWSSSIVLVHRGSENLVDF
jgi:hypothetical protein